MRDLDSYTRLYSENGFEDIQVKYRRRMVLEQISYYQPKEVLEIGCGYEPLFLFSPDISYTVVEPSRGFCENALKLSEGKDKTIHVINGEIEKVSERLDKKFDMIICSGLLHEVEKPIETIKAIKSLCNEETIIHINVPNANSMHRLLAKHTGYISTVYEMSERNVKLQQNMVFDIEGLVKMVNDCGLKVLKHGSYFVKPFTHDQMYQILKNNIIEEKVLDGFYMIEKYMPGLGSEIYVNCQIDNE